MSTIKLRRDTAANWSAANPILSLAEPGLETDTNKIKYGDGLTSWAGLPYASGGASTSTRWDAVPAQEGCPIYAELTPDHFQAFTQQSNLAIRNDGSWNIGSNYNGTGLYGLGNTATLYSNYGDVAIRVNESQSYFTFGADGTLTLPTDGSIDTYSGTGGFKITTDGQIQFASGYSIGGSDTGLGLRMATDRGTILFGNHPEPGTTTHFHIMKQDPYHVDLFLGDDFNYVKLKGNENIPPSMPYGVEIGTSDYFGSQNTWRFGTDGNLTLPNSTVIGTLSTGTSGIVAPIDTTFVVETNKSSVTTATSIINPGTGATPSNSTGTAGVRYVLGGPGGAGVGMQVRFTSGGYAGGQILNPTDIEIIDPGTGYQTGDQLTILNGNNDCSFTIQVTPQFNNTWRFGTDGTLTLPGNIQSPNSIGINVPNFPTLASMTTAIMSNGTVTTVSNFTTPSQSVIVIASGAETSTTTNTVSSIVSIVGLGLMWTRRAQYLDPASSNNQQAEVWYAINSSGNPITDNIVITFDNPVDDQGTVVSSYVGCNLDTPWTASGPFYSNSTDPSTNSATITMSIAEPHSAGIVFFGVPWDQENADGSFGTGFAVNWSNVAEADNGGAVLWEYDELSYRQFTLPQTDLVVTSKYSGTGTQYSQSVGLTVIADALVGNGGTSNWTINNGLAFPDGTLQTTAWNGSIPTRWDAVPVEAGCPIYTELTSDHFFAYTQNSHLALENAGDWNLGSNSNGTYIFAVGNTTTIYSNIGDVVISLNNSQSNFIFGLDGNLTVPGAVNHYVANTLTPFSINSWQDIQLTTGDGVNTGYQNWTFGLDGNLTIPAGGVISDSTDYLTTRNLHIQGALQGVDGSIGTTGQVLTRQSNGGVAWADATGSSSGVVFEAVNYPTGTSGDTKGTLAYNTLTNQMYLATDTYVQATTTTSTYTLTASQTVLNSQDIRGNMNFSFAVSDNPGLAQILYNISVANGSVQLSSPVLTGVRTTDPGVMNYDLDGINFSIQVPFQSGDPTEIDSGTAFTVTVTVTPSQPNIWHQLPIFDNNGVLTLPSGNTRIGNFEGIDQILSSPGNAFGVTSSGAGGSNALEWVNDINNVNGVAGIVVNPGIASTGSVQIYTGTLVPTPSNAWTFGNDGNLTVPGSITFPDNTVQTTAYVTGNQLIWAATDTGNGSITQAVAYDSQGNSYSLISQGNINNSGVFPATIVKRSSTGSELWKIDLGTDHTVNPWSLVCDGDNNLYAIVQRLNGSVYNNVVLKLNVTNGSILWQVDIQDSQNANNMQAAPFSGLGGMGPSSGVVVAGTAYNGTDNDFFITALGADGSFVGTLTYGDQWDQEAYSVAINPMSLDIVLVGRKKSNTDNAYYLEIIKIVSGAPPAWQKSITVDGNYDVQGTDVCLLPDGNWAVLATHQIDNNNNYGVITMKINNTDGSVVWSREISQGCTNISSSIATDSTGNIYISAMTYSGNNTPSGNVPITNRLIGAYDTNGNALWQKYFRTFDTSEVLVDPNWWNGIGQTGKQLAVYNDRLLVGTSVVTLGQSSPTGASAVVVQLTTQGENETIGAYETRNSYLTDSAVSLTMADTVFNYTTSTQTLSTGTSVSTTSSTLTFSLDHTGAYVNQLKNSGKTVTLEPNGTLLDGNGRNVTGEFDGATDSGNNFSNTPIGIRNASGYKRLVGLTNSVQTWFNINDVATQLGVNPAWIMGLTIEYNVVSSNLNNNGSMTGQIIISSSNNSSWNISVSHSEAVLTTSNSSNDIVFTNLNLWQPNGWTLQAIRTDSSSQQLDIIWTAKVFINASESYC